MYILKVNRFLVCAYLRLDCVEENIDGDTNLHQPPPGVGLQCTLFKEKVHSCIQTLTLVYSDPCLSNFRYLKHQEEDVFLNHEVKSSFISRRAYIWGRGSYSEESFVSEWGVYVRWAQFRGRGLCSGFEGNQETSSIAFFMYGCSPSAPK